MSILMSKENPDGLKLEELLLDLQVEITVKSQKIANDPSPVASKVYSNNQAIMRLLAQAEKLQRESLAVLSNLGADPGPTGEPRIGEGRYDREPQSISAADVGSLDDIMGRG